MGDYLGKSDIAQIRYFEDGNIDMNSLLNLPSAGEWIQYDFKGSPLRKSHSEMGKLIDDQLIVVGKKDDNPMKELKSSTKKKKRREKSKAKKSKSIFTLPNSEKINLF